MSKTEVKKVVFLTRIVSKAGNLRICVKPSRPLFEGGKKIGVEPGKVANFDKGRFETNDAEVIEKLRNSKTYGRDFYEAADEAKKEEIKTESKTGSNDLSLKTFGELKLIAKERGLDIKRLISKALLLEALSK